ncbi:MAG: phosphonate metabolism protein/1,5-bisphosphokinase (PRPP-forming) PhnN [Alphaproteobacteria bacterium]|nr:phosphonate metabolism protein/1,5-bisphosphokinase (PRPP-forming) PhnN [Alphaproteobacteria bacterium]
MARGTLYLIVGPSGAGKDTLLDGAKARLGDADDIVFAKRVITRPADAGGEDHEAMSEGDFDRAVENGAFLLHWASHGLHYGIPGRYGNDLRAGADVVANVSRAVLNEARERFQPVRIVNITAPRAVLRERLLARGREDADAVERRLARADAYRVEGTDVITIQNDKPLDEGVGALVSVLTHRPAA